MPALDPSPWIKERSMICTRFFPPEDRHRRLRIRSTFGAIRRVKRLVLWANTRATATSDTREEPGGSVHRERENFTRLVLGWLAGW